MTFQQTQWKKKKKTKTNPNTPATTHKKNQPSSLLFPSELSTMGTSSQLSSKRPCMWPVGRISSECFVVLLGVKTPTRYFGEHPKKQNRLAESLDTLGFDPQPQSKGGFPGFKRHLTISNDAICNIILSQTLLYYPQWFGRVL